MLPFIDKLREIENDTERKTGLRSVARRLLRNMQQRKCNSSYNDFIDSNSP